MGSVYYLLTTSPLTRLITTRKQDCSVSLAGAHSKPWSAGKNEDLPADYSSYSQRTGDTWTAVVCDRPVIRVEAETFVVCKVASFRDSIVLEENMP